MTDAVDDGAPKGLLLVVTTLRRGPRLEPPSVPEGQVALQAPPETPGSEGSGNALMMALPMLGSVGSIVFVATSRPGPTGFLAGGMFLVAALGFVGVSFWRQRAQRHTKAADQRREYLHYLAQVRDTARQAAQQQRDALLWDHPEPAHLPALAEERSRVWERQVGDPDFLQVRYGLAPQPLSLTLEPPESAPLDRLDPVAASALHRLLATHRVQPDLPSSFDLRAFARVEVTGRAEKVRAMARSMVCAAATFHSPDQLVVAVVASDDALAAWEWVKWLPHAGSARERDGAGPSRLVATSLDELLPLLPEDMHERPRWVPSDAPSAPHVLLVVDGGHVPPGNPVLTEDGVLGVTVLDLPAYWGELEDDTRLRFHVTDTERADGRAELRALRVRQEPVEALGDQVDVASAEALARRLTPLFVSGSGPGGDAASSNDLMDLLGLPHVHDLDVTGAWRARPARDELRVPFGLADDGTPAYLDLKESAQQGMGPHGLVIGATGSGKSEFLRTLVLALVLTHSPERLNLVLVDFKGGATFAGMADMPHVSAVITNLAQEITLVDRMRDALSGEMTRRQEKLREADNCQNIKEYEKLRQQRPDLDPLPHLFVCVDEFSELLSEKPEFIDLFVAMGRLGRSLGIHLLLASQRLEEGRLRGLDSHLSYRIGLRTFSSSESRTVLGVPDAYELPPVPGVGILKPDPTTFTRFQAAYVSGAPTARASRARRSSGGTRQEIVPFALGPVARPASYEEAPAPEPEPAPAAADGRSVLDVAVDAMRDHGPTAHQVWLPPLDVPATLDGLLPDLRVEPGLGLVDKHWRAAGPLRVPVGLVDMPLEQRRDALEVDLSGAGGHVAVVGAPLAGKSTMARGLVAALALTHTPQEVQFYVLDFGGSFATMNGLPHLSGTAGRSEPEVVRRIIAEVQGIVERREAFFRAHDIDAIETYRSRRVPGGDVDDGYGDVFLVVDGWSTLRSEFDMLEMELQDLAQRGLTFGVHLLTTTTRWSDYRTAMRDLFGTRLELRLGDPLDSEIDRRVSVNVPKERPGRGILPTRHHFLGALPRLDGDPDGGSVADGVTGLVRAVAEAWGGPTGPQLRLLPEREPLETTHARAGHTLAGSRALVVGVDEKDLAPVRLDVDAEPHVLVFGEAQSGKTAFLRTYLREVMRTRTPDEAKIVVLDYKRGLLGEVPDEYSVGYLSSGVQADPEVKALVQYLQTRLPGPDVTAQQLRDRSWWSGPDLFVVVDDYDLVSTSSGSPVHALVDLLPQAKDLGLHLVVARRSGGASRAMYEPVIQSLRDLSMPGLLLPGDPNEGQLLGSLRPKWGPPGRAQMVSRARGTEVLQVSYTERAF